MAFLPSHRCDGPDEVGVEAVRMHDVEIVDIENLSQSSRRS
jgi:hypothetical protein